MITRIFRTAALSLLLVAAPSFANRGVELRNPDPVRVSALTPQKLSAAQVRRAIVVGGAEHGWALKSETADALVLKLEKGKYYVEIRLPYSAEGYSIEYLTSTKLNYRLEAPSTAPNVFPTPGVEVDPNAKPVAMIHPGYMRWIAILTKTVNAQLIAMVAEP